MSPKRNTGMLVIGSLLILFGFLALLGRLLSGLSFWQHSWPLFIIGFGLMFFIGMVIGGKSVSGLAIPGSIITVIGVMQLVMEIFGHWEAWAYGWTVILFSVGLGIFIMGLWNGNASSRRGGLRVMETGLILFVIFGAIFEMLFNGGRMGTVSGIVFPVGLMVAGLYLVLARSGLFKSRKRTELPVDQPVVIPSVDGDKNPQ
jgi:hypothetical protein